MPRGDADQPRPRGGQPLSLGEPTRRLELRLPASLLGAARARAQAEGTTVSELVRQGLEIRLGRTERGG